MTQGELQDVAHRAVTRALRYGQLLRPAACEACSKEAKLYGHHPDYTKPLEVIWFCYRCHADEHKRLRRAQL